MCGIAGISANNSVNPSIVARSIEIMLTTLEHRGPDDYGSICLDAGNVAIANARLAILDLSPAGHQPMCDPITGNWIVLNGEIYNHWEVRSELGVKGGSWKSSSDTETVLKAYGAWGSECLNRVRGMFAFAVWDSRKKVLFCARDRFGMKPFYYWSDVNTLAFASEIRTLIKSGIVVARVDPVGLAGYIRFGSVPEPLTLLEGVKSLPAGHWMRIRAGCVEDSQRYWSPRGFSKGVSEREQVATIRGHLERSVKEHMLSDVPVATFLSGGVDSSVITALAARVSSRKVESITFGFREAELDESRFAETVASYCGTRHHRIVLSDDEVAALVPDAVAALDLPTSDGINTYVVARLAKQAGKTVVLAGLGGDELFGGYPSFRALPWAHRLTKVTGWANKLGHNLDIHANSSHQRAIEIAFGGGELRDMYQSLRSFWSIRELRQMGLQPVGFGLSGDVCAGWPLRTQVSWLEMKGYMSTTLLRDGDAMSMAHSLEMRLPFLDHELVESCLSMGVAERAGPSGFKRILVLAAADLLPPGIGKRKKQGFVLPMDKWMRQSLSKYVSSGLVKLTATGLLPGIDLVALERQFETRKLHWARLWQFVVLGHWAERHLG